MRQSKIFYSGQSPKETKETEKSMKGLRFFDKLTQLPSKKLNAIDQSQFPCVKFEERNFSPTPLSYFIEFTGNSYKPEKLVQRLVHQNESDRKNNHSGYKESVKYTEFPLLIQSVLGSDCNRDMASNDNAMFKTRNQATGYRKQPNQYATNLSSYKKWDSNE